MKRAPASTLRLRWLAGASACVAALGMVLAPQWAQAEAERPKVAVLVFDRAPGTANVAVRIERDLRNMYDSASSENPKIPTTIPIERRYDVGHLSKSHLERARTHFNEAQRNLEAHEYDEAMEQLFRAERFYGRGIPFVSDHGLLRGIFFYYYLARLGAGLQDEARENYCAYVALTRNLAGSTGPIEQFEPLADKCGDTKISGTAELKVTADVDGAHVYVDDQAVGVIGRDVPYVDPFIPAGPHLVEVRKAGFARWGTLVTIKKGKTENLRAKLKEAKNRAEDFDSLAGMLFTGPDAFSEEYISDLLFQTVERFRVAEIVLGYVHDVAGKRTLTLFSFTDGASERRDYPLTNDLDGHRAALMEFWQARFQQKLDPADALPVADRWAPTLFKVE